jgi:hypothetical protein
MTYPYQPDPFADRTQAKSIYDQAAQMATRARTDLAAAQAIKGLALWCETGGHAFSQRDRGRQEWQVRVFDVDAGEEVTETRVCCSRCAKTGSITDKAKHLPAELVAQAPELERRPPARPVADPEYTAYLEWQAQQPIGAKVGLADYFRAMGVAAEPNTGVG